MFDLLLWATLAVIVTGVLIAYDGSRDVFHPLFFIGPMMAFLYWWMPMELEASGSLAQFFDSEQLIFVQTLNFCGISAFVWGCLAAGTRFRRGERTTLDSFSALSCHRLRVGAVLTGGVGLVCWLISIVNVGGFVKAFSKSYSGGWDDSGYVRDGNLLLLVGLLLAVAVITSEGPRFSNMAIATIFGGPWLVQALLTARRGPTFAFAVVTAMGFCLLKGKRPPVVATIVGGLFLGWLALFLVTNRSNIYLGSQASLSTSSDDVTDIVEKSDTGNEYIYGSGSVISADRRNHYFWMRRYLAQLIVRPIPSSIWSTKYEDFGVPELLNNAGTGEGFADALGWKGAVGSAPGIVSDLWLELWWLAVPAMAVLGWAYGAVWRKAITQGPAWRCQYVIVSALSIYLIMQTMEAVIFRTLLLSIPLWLVWRWTLGRTQPSRQPLNAIVTLDARTAKELGIYGA